jgi:hypothetical protein
MKFGKFSLKTISKKGVIFGLSAGVALGVTGAAFAYFSSTGSGTGSASVGTSTTWGVSVTTATGGPLLPGGTSTESQNYVITNNSAGTQGITGVTATVANSGAGNACLGAWFTATPSTPSTGLVTSIAPGGTATGTITITMQDTGTNQDACKSVTPVVTLNVT